IIARRPDFDTVRTSARQVSLYSRDAGRRLQAWLGCSRGPHRPWKGRGVRLPHRRTHHENGPARNQGGSSRAFALKEAGHFRERQRSEEHTSELQSPDHLVCRLLLEKKKK